MVLSEAKDHLQRLENQQSAATAMDFQTATDGIDRTGNERSSSQEIHQDQLQEDNIPHQTEDAGTAMDKPFVSPIKFECYAAFVFNWLFYREEIKKKEIRRTL